MSATAKPRNRLGLLAVLLVGALAVPAVAGAHVERSTYWPDPAPDAGVHPPAGGEVPTYRPLSVTLEQPRRTTRVVCQQNSMRLVRSAVRGARTDGFKVHPTANRNTLNAREARRLIRTNRQLRERCNYHNIQAAVNDSGNNDNVIVMPGLYLEKPSRAAPTNDPACADLTSDSDKGSGAVTYQYQAECPNDQNLIAIIGREPTGEPEPPVDPDTDRRGIPHQLLGHCIRCNLQIEGSGVTPNDVVIEVGDPSSGNGAPIVPAKDVGIRGERTDGLYLRNFTVRHAAEHGVYMLETDGYAIDRVNMFYNAEYGHLSFTSDHGLMKDCEATGSGDAGVYPGAAPQTGEQTVEEGGPRFNQEIRDCDIHHNVLGHSGSMGDAVYLNNNDFYDNAVGISVDSISAAGHPGYPQDSTLVEGNNIYSNNFNPFEEGSDVEPTVPAAVGTGMWIAGGNADIVRNNHIYDNWRRGVMLFAVPDAIACAPTAPQQTCDEVGTSTSFRNRFHDNAMGISPHGEVHPNGLDFWWDQFPGNTNNCWFDNVGKDGTPGSVTSDPPAPLLPANCELSIGTGDPAKEAELTACFVAFQGGPAETCPWFETPPKP